MAFISDPSVAIILVNWNGYAYTAACLTSLGKIDFPTYRIFVVDNASQNREGQRLKEEFPEIQLVGNSENLGFAGGNNVGIREALEETFSHIMLLNNDTEVEPDFLGKMLEGFSNTLGHGIVQPLICFLHAKDQVWSAGGKWNSILGRAITLGDRRNRLEYNAHSQALDWATGCCMLISREALLDVGLLNEQYFAYFEDVEWSLRFREKGYAIRLAADAVIYHEAGASSKKKHAEGTLSPRVFYYHVRNQFYILRSQVTGILAPFAYSYHIGRFVVWMMYFCLRGRFQKLKSVATGIREGLFDPLQKAPTWP
ncbi:glycosyltransferase family 2 protein [Algoriphagus aquimarinus]|uniref:glycosyltransferase family 2 protein n=1 Tax=Algoriphagus aquimarinus TaxID=237018 RepID=UPI0030D84747|tara:strand:+ start:3047 stop:3982 length:936 start_codon:yes stop_codon:yes gene_type:complete